jgi:hypothetical protein
VHPASRVLIFAQVHSQNKYTAKHFEKKDACLNISIAIMLFQVVGVFAKLRKVNVSFVMSVCPSVRMAQLGSHWTDFNESYIRVFLENLARNFKFIKISQE